MTLFDTNVLIYAMEPHSPFHDWATRLIVDEATKGDAAVNTVSVAEICVGSEDPHVVIDDIPDWGIQMFDVPTEIAAPCAVAYRLYRQRRFLDSGKSAPDVPLPDFFIGAHAEIMGWEIATADRARFSTYFPTVKLITPHDDFRPAGE